MGKPISNATTQSSKLFAGDILTVMQQWNKVSSIQTPDSLIYTGYAGAFASFFQTGDPNSHKITNSSIPGVPESWRTGEEFVITADGFADVEVEELGLRCGFWRQLADDVPV